LSKKIRIEVDEKYFNALGNIFSPKVIDNLCLNQHSPYLEEICINSGLYKNFHSKLTLGDLFESVYKFLFVNYRNEYVYKNIIANRILGGHHTHNETQILTEFRIGKCKADILLLNGTSTIYEIKSELDSFVRLENQIKSYLNAFDNIYVISSENQIEKLKDFLPKEIGILVPIGVDDVLTIREAISNKKNINNSILFDSLRKNEYSSIIEEYYGKLPDVPNTKYYSVCKKLFSELTPVEAHDLSIKVLKKRNSTKLLNLFIKKAPSSTFAYAVSIADNEKKILRLIDIFEEKLINYINIEIT